MDLIKVQLVFNLTAVEKAEAPETDEVKKTLTIPTHHKEYVNKEVWKGIVQTIHNGMRQPESEDEDGCDPLESVEVEEEHCKNIHYTVSGKVGVSMDELKKAVENGIRQVNITLESRFDED